VAERFKRNNTWVVPTLLVDGIESGKQSVTVTEKAQAILKRFAARADEFRSGSLLHANGNWLHDSTRSDVPQASGADSLGLLSVMQRAGLPILSGTDVGAGFLMPPGFALHTELALEVVEGLTPLTALQSATLNPAKMWHATDSLGTVAPGKLADLVLLNADPLADITNTTTIHAVVANGRYYDRAAIDSLLAAVQARKR
jgi:imidazolonepropionase-like amidohydrolase